MSRPPEVVLAVEGLRIETDGRIEIVDDVSFEVRSGEVLSLVGESGCGKTSVALALLGYARPGTRIAAGRIMLEGRDLLQLKHAALRKVRGARVSYVPQDPTVGLNPRHRLGDQVAEVLRVHGASSARSEESVRGVFQRVQLPSDESFLHRYPFELSGGQQQRVAIGMALITDPAVVVLDEPTTGLDVTTQARILELLRAMAAEVSAAFVYVTHDLAVVDGLADRVAVLYSGRVIESGPRAAVFGRPSHPYTAMLLASVPRLRVRHELVGIPGTAAPPGGRPAGCFFEPRCPIGVDKCRSEFPDVSDLGGNHSVRCWRAGEIRQTWLSDDARASGRVHEPTELERSVLGIDGLSATFGRGVNSREVLSNITLTVGDAECVALVGESGSGKTTLGRCVAGLHRPETGVITLDGSVLAPLTTERSRIERRLIQIVFQNPDRSLNPSETIGDAVARPLRLFGVVKRGGERQAVMELLDRVRLPTAKIDRYPREVSGGEKQRVALARALAARPRLLVCDEISSALDVSTQAAIVALLQDLQRDGLALLFITHNLALVNSIAHRVMVIQSGRMCEEGATSEIIRRPSHSYTRNLLASAPELRALEYSGAQRP